MPIPALGALITSGATLLGGASNALSTGIQNRRSRAFSNQQYQRQFDDNVRLWRMQNDYNNPAAQMRRLKGAGINPAVMYGGSASGAAGNAGSVSAPSAQSAQFQPNRLGDSLASSAGTGINAIYDLRRKGLENDNLRAQNNVIVQDAALRAAQIEKTVSDTKTSKFDLGLKSELRAVSAEAMRENLRQIKYRNQFDYENQDMKRQMHGPKLEQLRASIRGTQAATRLKKLEAELQQVGLSSSSPFYFRLLARMLNMDPKMRKFFKR